MKKTETEVLIMSAQLEMFSNPRVIHYMCRHGYELTGNKFSVSWHGSKGYLDNLAIECEGFQKADNSIREIFNKDMSVKKKKVNVYWSKAEGVRLSVGKDNARKVESKQPWIDPLTNFTF